MSRCTWRIKTLLLGGVLLSLAGAHAVVDVASEPFFNSDETRHVMTGVFFRDLFAEMPVCHLRDYTIRYYLQYPALSLLIWPPFFYVVEGVAMLFLGCGMWAAKATVAVFAAMACTYLFRLVCRTHDAWTAAVAVLIFGFAPQIFTYSRQVMLEMPTLACALAAIFHFVRYLDTGWRRDIFFAALAAACAALTRFDAVYLLPFFLLLLAMRGRLGLLRQKDVLLAAALALALVVPVYGLTFLEIGGGHLRSIEAGNDVSSGFFGLKNLLFYPNCVLRQLGWFALVSACVAIIAAAKTGLQNSGPYAAMLVTTFITFAFLGIVEARHAIYWVPAFTFFAAAGVAFASHMFGGWLHPALASLVIGGTCWTACQTPAPFVRGYEAVARYVVANNNSSPFCLVDTYLEGNLLYYIRLHDAQRRLWVLRGDKLFYSVMSDPSYAYVEHVKDQAAILAEIFQYDPEMIVIEDPRLGPALPMADKLRAAIREHPERFQLEKVFDIDSNQATFAGAKLKVYRNLLRNPASAHRVDIDMLWLRRRLGISVPQ
jgi:hypothetical protein